MMKIRYLFKKIIDPFYKSYHQWYHIKPRKYSYKNVWTIVNPTVFSPRHTLSTKIFLDYISNLNLVEKNVLELGCGSGIISIYCAFKKARVMASDINNNALEGVKTASEKQNLIVHTLYSDLFQDISIIEFDYIFINPPYYPKKAINISDHAWFCGEKFEYFKKLFSQLHEFMNLKTNIYMILSEDCELDIILNLAKKEQLSWMRIHQINKRFEKNYIFKILKQEF